MYIKTAFNNETLTTQLFSLLINYNNVYIYIYIYIYIYKFINTYIIHVAIKF